MLDENFIKDNYKNIVGEGNKDNLYSHRNDMFLFSPNKKSCVICDDAYEQSMNYYIWRLTVVHEDATGFLFNVLDGYYSMPNDMGVWINDNVFCVSYLTNEIELPLAIKYLDFSEFRSFKIPNYPKQISDTKQFKNKHFIYESKPIPVVYIDPYKQGYEEYLTDADWKDIPIKKLRKIKK